MSLLESGPDMQEVKVFHQGSLPNGKLEPKELTDQINEFLKENPNYSAKSISVMPIHMTWMAFVIFDVYDKNKNRNNRYDDKKSNGKGDVTNDR